MISPRAARTKIVRSKTGSVQCVCVFTVPNKTSSSFNSIAVDDSSFDAEYRECVCDTLWLMLLLRVQAIRWVDDVADVAVNATTVVLTFEISVEIRNNRAIALKSEFILQRYKSFGVNDRSSVGSTYWMLLDVEYNTWSGLKLQLRFGVVTYSHVTGFIQSR